MFLLFAGALISRASVAQQPPLYPIGMVGCNDDSIHQIPGNPDFFVGRIPISTDAAGNRLPPPGNFGCETAQQWALGLLKMDWSAMQLSFVSMLLWPNARDDRFPKTPIQGGKYVLDSTYDATVSLLDGEMWLSFECAGQGFYTSSCLGPLTSGPIEGMSVDLDRTVIVVLGTANAAASVPKIFTFMGIPYLYFDYFLVGPGYLQQMGDSMAIDDPAAIRVLMPNVADPLSSNMADVFYVFSGGGNDTYIYATQGIGGVGCRAPTDAPQGCYRLAISRSRFPLGELVWDEYYYDGANLPGNAMEYAKLLTVPASACSGRVHGGQSVGSPPANQTLLYAQFLDPRGPPGYQIPKNFQAFPAPSDGPFWSGAVSCQEPMYRKSAQPAPDWGERSGACVLSCGMLGNSTAGVINFVSSCARNGHKSLGPAWDVPWCCAPIVCGDVDHPAPNWGVKGGLCLPSCGGIGGTAGYNDRLLCWTVL